ncbi:hypothetical protein [Nocardioides convexus]|uniref:hypothetical protein n=1 Tax=Nocardioides convexus TaxID=2712224 RepID=UPI0024183F43|nr:hypothetical protein [Nocardioides convexus]
MVVNTGKTFDPQRMLGTMRLADVDRGTDASGNHLIRIAGKPVRWALGCNFDVWPWACPATASSDAVRFGGDIAQLTDPTDTSIGMYVGTNAYYNGIFFEEQPDGSHALTTDIAAPHYYADGSTVITGSIRFRVSYDLMRTDMGIPNPETLTSTSLAGAVKTPTGAPAAGKFVTWHDPDGGGFFIEASGFTFSRKRLLVDAARITPTRPALARTVRKTARRGVLVHTRALPRGARVTSYAAYCRSASGHVVRASGAPGSSVVVVTGLRRGRSYRLQGGRELQGRPRCVERAAHPARPSLTLRPRAVPAARPAPASRGRPRGWRSTPHGRCATPTPCGWRTRSRDSRMVLNDSSA